MCGRSENIALISVSELNENERNYITHELEPTIIVHALKPWRNYLLQRKFVLISNHGGLMYLFDQPKFNERKERWLELINEFDFGIKYMKYKENKVAYSLSRSLLVAHVVAMRTYEIYVKERIKEAFLHDENYQHVKECF